MISDVLFEAAAAIRGVDVTAARAAGGKNGF
jgi:hypothetical protein